MALAEQISRKVHKLGLVPKFIRLLPVFSAVLALASVAWILVLPLEGNYRTTYISENALMPAQANSYFRESEWNIVRGYRTEVKNFETWKLSERNSVVEGWLQDIGLKTGYFEDTLYAIMHAPRGDHTESMVVAVPWTTSDLKYNEGGVALGAALARYFSRMSIWSKNIVFVFPEDGSVSLRSWVAAYHTSLDLTAGSIDAAIVMEFGGSSDYFESYEISYEGLNGQLPNLDLMNTANLVGFHEGLKYSIQSTPSSEIEKNTYYTRLRTLVKGIVNLTLTGLYKPTNGCESFSGWQIQAITLKARGTEGAPDITQFGRIVDSTLRSVNNLLEKFHQSFFFYLMLSPRYFVSIGTYLPAAALVAAAFAFSALGCVLNSGVPTKQITSEIGPLLAYFTGIGAFCYLLAVGLPYITWLSSGDDEAATVTFILYGLTFLTGTVSLLPLINARNRRYFKFSKAITFSLLAIGLFYLAMLVFALLIVHFSLALCVGFLALPLTWIQPIITSSQRATPIVLTQPEKSDPLSRFIKFVDANKPIIKVVLCLVCSSPFFVIYLIGNYLFSTKDTNGVVMLMRGLLTSWDELQCWTWFVIVLGWLPAWLSVGLCCTFGDFSTTAKLKKQ
ncbi:GPI transamidase component Gaa1p [[Candida] anglica]|uniref:GPI transamidase component Gaa1p n=1 Tax=[Candida] anglica TaxID=148631 RepID=A0ABP0ECU8_9ASCO